VVVWEKLGTFSNPGGFRNSIAGLSAAATGNDRKQAKTTKHRRHMAFSFRDIERSSV
jgi:hypothetical protein